MNIKIFLFRAKKHLLMSSFSAFFTIVFCSLGVWQINKGMAKSVLENNFNTMVTVKEFSLDLPVWSYVYATGSFDFSRQILFDNQLNNSRLGYKVFTPFIDESGTFLIVDRGWIEKDYQFSDLVPSENIKNTRISGRLYNPESNITFGTNLITKSWPKVSQKRSHELFNEQYKEEVFKNFIHLDANHPNILSFSYLNPFVISSKRHFGYALTWFTMAIVLISMFIYFVSTQDEE